MHFIIFIISAIILNIVLNTVLGIVFTIYRSSNEKLKVGLLTFLHSSLYAISVWFIADSKVDNNLWWIGGFLLAVLTRDTVFSNRKYLSGLVISDMGITVNYITLKKLELPKMKNTFQYPGSLDICYSVEDDERVITDKEQPFMVDKDQQFIILDKKIWDAVSKTLNLAYINNLSAG